MCEWEPSGAVGDPRKLAMEAMDSSCDGGITGCEQEASSHAPCTGPTAKGGAKT